MFEEALAEQLGVSLHDIQLFLSMPADELRKNALYQSLLEDIDADYLYGTLGEARRALDGILPGLVDYVKSKYHVAHFPLTSYMLGNWVVGFLNYPDELWRLSKIHRQIPPHIMHEVVPEVLAGLGEMSTGSSAWQRAFAVIVVPMLNESQR